jgi:hypothetical protein
MMRSSAHSVLPATDELCETAGQGSPPGEFLAIQPVLRSCYMAAVSSTVTRVMYKAFQNDNMTD